MADDKVQWRSVVTTGIGLRTAGRNCRKVDSHLISEYITRIKLIVLIHHMFNPYPAHVENIVSSYRC